MKKVMVFIPIVVSLLVLGAHFLRYGNSPGVLASLVLIALLMVRRPWVARMVQIVLVLGALEWVHTLYELVQTRAAHDEPFTRMAVILGVVAAVTFCSALLFQTPVLKRIYWLRRRE